MLGEVLPIRVEVTAYSGYKANERPLSFTLENTKICVEDIVDRWYGVESDYFKILADDGKVYLIKWNRSLDLWFIEKIMEKMGKQ